MYNDFLYYQLYKDIIYLDITAVVYYKIYFKLVKAGALNAVQNRSHARTYLLVQAIRRSHSGAL